MENGFIFTLLLGPPPPNEAERLALFSQGPGIEQKAELP